MFYAALTPLLPHYAEELGLSKAGAGLLAGAYALGALAGGDPGGHRSRRALGVKPTILFGLSGMIVTTALFGFAHERMAARRRALPPGLRERVLVDGGPCVARRRRAGRTRADG